MGRMLGVFDNDEELDRPDLNKCPDCGCFFPGDNCPLCGKVCPEEMRAGNRKPVKKAKVRRSSGSGRVSFVQWYHSWWFIVLMMFIMPIAGIILLLTSPHEKWKKLLLVGIAVLYMAVSTFGFMIVPYLTDLFDKPVDTSLSREEYLAACQSVNAETLHRSPNVYEDEFVTITLTVMERAESYDYSATERVYYICRATDGSELTVIIRDCLIDNSQRLLPGDVITVFGEGEGEITVYNQNYDPCTAPCINMAYLTIIE